MKKILIILICVALCITVFSGCDIKRQDNSKLNVVCTVFPQYDFLRQIAGEKVNLKMLVPLGTESHDFKLENMSVADIRTVHEADLVVYVGGEGDAKWVEKLKSTVENDALWLALTDMTELLCEASTDNMQHVHEHHEHDEHHDHSDSFDEHVWTSPKRAVQIVENLTQNLCLLDSDNEQTYKQNCAEYVQQLMLLDDELMSLDLKGKSLIFSDRFPFRYLCADYGLSFDAAFSGCSAVTDPSVAQINKLCKSATEHNAKVIFYIESSNQIFAQGIAEKVGAEPLLLHSCHNVSLQEFNSGVTYVSLMKLNIQNILKAVKEATN